MGCWNCGCESMWFDRTMEPPCDSMHNVCEACSETQSCGDDKCLYGVKTDKKLHCSSAGQRGGEVVEKCPKCNDPKCYAHTLWADDVDEVECLTRQLAAANERAGRLEAEMVELRAAWFRVATHDGFNGSIEAEISEGDMAVFTSILGGA